MKLRDMANCVLFELYQSAARKDSEPDYRFEYLYGALEKHFSKTQVVLAIKSIGNSGYIFTHSRTDGITSVELTAEGYVHVEREIEKDDSIFQVLSERGLDAGIEFINTNEIESQPGLSIPQSQPTLVPFEVREEEALEQDQQDRGAYKQGSVRISPNQPSAVTAVEGMADDGIARIPASDRVVTLDHNNPDHSEVDENLDFLVERITVSPIGNSDDGTRIVAELKALKTLWQSPTVRIATISVIAERALNSLVDLFPSDEIGGVALATWELIKGMIGL